MNYTQLIQPNPNVWCRPGWCLAYVKDAFGLNAVYPSATAAWNASHTKHRDRNFPANVWVPLWFSMVTEPLGHVVLRAPDGSVYSTSNNSNTAYHHPTLEHLMAYYAYYGQPLNYLGWSEDVESQSVVSPVELEKDIEMPLTPGELEQIQKFSNENGDRVINMLRAEQNAKFEALIKLMGTALDIDESALADALLAKGKVTVEKQ